jgi:hypothetical protein
MRKNYNAKNENYIINSKDRVMSNFNLLLENGMFYEIDDTDAFEFDSDMIKLQSNFISILNLNYYVNSQVIISKDYIDSNMA